MTHILIADEDRAGRTVLANLLAQSPGLDLSGVEIVKASSEPEALEMLAVAAPRIVIVGMLGSGARTLALCQAIRRMPAGRSTQIAVVGAQAPGRDLLERLQTAVAARFFSKPFELDKLVSFVAAAVGRDLATREVDRQATNYGEGSEGELAERRLPAVLLDLVEAKETGTLHLVRGKIHKSVVLSGGHPVSVRSNAREETLGQFLRGHGVISAEHHAAAIRQSAASRRRIGEVLVGLGALTEAQLLDALAAQVRFKLVRSLRWPDGTWRFEPLREVTAAAGAPPLSINVVDLILRGLRETARLSPMPPHLRALRDVPLRLSDRGRRLRPAWTQVFGEVGDAIAADTTAAALIDRGFARDSVYGLLDALWLCDGLAADDAAPVEIRGSAAGDRSEGFSIRELRARSERSRTDGPPLHDVLFGDAGDDELTGTEPIAVSPRAASEFGDQRTAVPKAPPQALLQAYLRIQGANHYDVVGAAPTDSRDAIETAIAEAETELAAAGLLAAETAEQPLARAVRDAFGAARATLLDDSARVAYDRSLERATREGTAGGIDAEVAYERALEAIRRKEWADAVRDLHTAVELAPHEATYRAELGWCHYLKGHRTARAADQARPHLNQALAIDVDHAAAHEYKGVISADLGTDEVEALFHLQRALDADPGRASALEAFEQLLSRRGEHRRLERQYRRLIQRVAGSHLELDLWLRMARLYRNKLNDPASARIAFEAAAQLAPEDPEIEALITDLEAGRGGRFFAESAVYYQRWSAAPHDPEPGRRLLAMATDAGLHDHAFIAASNLVAIGAADKRAEELFRRYRPRFAIRAQRQLDSDTWAALATDADSPRVSALLALLAPAIHQLMPVTLSELEVSGSARVSEDRLPAAFVDVRAYAGHMLGVPEPPVYIRGDLDQQIHVGGVNPPVLLVGSEILSTPERLELAFRLGRAMTYLLPGRALGGSHPAGALKRFVLAAYYVKHPELDGPPELAPVIAAVGSLPSAALHQIGALVDELGATQPNLNLSEWRRGLARTANRVGLLLCGDVPASVRFVVDTTGSEAATELLGFASSPAFPALRRALGLSIDV